VINRVHIKNFRCIREATIDLAPLTVLVGPNASGKSTILEAIAPQRPLAAPDVWMKDPTLGVEIELTSTSGTSARRELTPIGAYSWDGRGYKTQQLRLDLETLRGPNVVARAESLAATGGNLVNVFASLTRKQQELLAQELCRLVPVFSDVEATPVGGGKYQLRFLDRWSQSVWYLPDEVSDGTMLMTAFLTLQYQQAPLDMLAIEEPDRGLHPYLVNQLLALLRGMTTGEIGGKPTQIVLATHSAELLDYVKPQEVRFLNRDKATGAVVVHAIDPASPDWRTAYDEYRESLGSVWLSGGLGGVPGV
jgi:predicted ATPase